MKKFVHYDTGRHGYLKVSKRDFLSLGGDPTKISGYSGHTIDTLFLEEDADATYFLDLLNSKGVAYDVETKHVRSVTSHNYSPEFFYWNYDSKVVLFDGCVATLDKVAKRVMCDDGRMYRIPTSKVNAPFEYFKAIHR